jgi:hypothetical protein
MKSSRNPHSIADSGLSLKKQQHLFSMLSVLTRRTICSGFRRAAHSLSSTSYHSDALLVRIIPALEDNYTYLALEPGSMKAVAIDPVDADALLHEVSV